MLHDLVKTYADAMYVATMLRTPLPARSACEDADREPSTHGRSLAHRVFDWLARALATAPDPMVLQRRR